MHQRAERRPYSLEEVGDLAAMRGWGGLDEKLAKFGERVAIVGVDGENLTRGEHPQHTPKRSGIRGSRGRDFVAGARSFVEEFGNVEFRGHMYRLAGGGHKNRPCSSRFAYSDIPIPSCQIILIRSPLAPLKT
jgi:hypothetical protein